MTSVLALFTKYKSGDQIKQVIGRSI